MELLRKYGVQTDFYFPLIKAAVQNFAVSADYTHTAGDVKISKDGGAAATATNAPSAITMGNGAIWKLTLTATEMSAALIVITIIDATTKAIEDQAILVSTYGNASAQHPFDLATATQNVNTSTITNGAIAAATFAAGAIDSSAIATDAIGSAELAASAVTEIVNGIWDEVESGHVAVGSFGQVLQSVRANTAQAGAASTITLDASASAVDDFYKGQVIYISAGTGAGQSRLITGYVGSTKVATVQPNWVTNPGVTSVFAIRYDGQKIVTALSIQAIWDALTSALTTSSSIGKLLTDNINATISSRSTQTSVDTVAGYIDTEVAAIKAKTDNLPSDPADASDITAAIAALNNISVANILAGVIEGSLTLKDVLRLVLAAEAGKSSGGGTTTVTFRDNADSKNRISATVNSSGNRTAVTLDAS